VRLVYKGLNISIVILLILKVFKILKSISRVKNKVMLVFIDRVRDIR
jgi:hypothetical protein